MRKIQLDFIDGLRALLALYIVVHHAVQPLRQVPRVFAWLDYGQAVVAVFITVSGFCLALPQASSGQWTVDARAFYLRRARRILPPYYATVGIAILLCSVYLALGPFRDPVAEFSLAAVMSHLLLVQNWMPQQMYTLDGPLWSVALECQIYLLFPLLVLLCRRFGIGVMLAVSLGTSVVVFRAFHALGEPQFLFCFALGLLSAKLGFAESRPWVPLLLTGAGIAAYMLTPQPSITEQEVCASLASAGLIAWCCRRPASAPRRLLEWKPLAWVGTFSYSMYLIHALAFPPVWIWARSRWPDFGERFDAPVIALTVATCMAAVGISYGFHVMFERPFISGKRRGTEHRLATAAA